MVKKLTMIVIEYNKDNKDEADNIVFVESNTDDMVMLGALVRGCGFDSRSRGPWFESYPRLSEILWSSTRPKCELATWKDSVCAMPGRRMLAAHKPWVK